ncbi:MAG: DMT family transporter [Planctomycetales bacterium]|nr:DMT family transporter [Planctomycetales bacterium]
MGIVCVAIGIHTLWGGNPIAVKLGLEAFPPLWSGLLRFTLGCFCVSAWARYVGVSLLPARDEWLALTTIGLIFTLQVALMNVGIGATSATNGAVLISTNPLFGVLFAHLIVPGDSVCLRRAAGCVIAFVGVVIVLMRNTAIGGPLGGLGDWMVLASACLLGLRLALSGRLLQRGNEVRLTFWQMLLSLPLFACGAVSWEEIHWEKVGVLPIAGILYQGIVIAGLAFTVNFYLMRRFSPSVMISFNFVAPVAGVLIGNTVLKEPISFGLLAGLIFVALGLILIARRPSR